jgi:4-hydroxy-tetrahydrodipicolinate synthase
LAFLPEGIFSAMPTPFRKDESLDVEAIRTLVQFYTKAGLSGVLVLGTSGELAMLTDKEVQEVVDAAVDEAAGQTKIVVGTGMPSTRKTIQFTKYARDAGADAALVVAPYYFHPNSQGIKEHYVAVARQTRFPIIVYNIPSFSATTITPEMIDTFSREDNIVAIKDSSGRLFDVVEMIRLSPPEFSILCGWDPLFMVSLFHGAKGGMLGSAAVAPRLLLDLYEASMSRRVNEAIELQRRVNLVFRAMFIGTYPAALKAALNLIGLPGGFVRTPLENLKEPEIARVRLDLETAGILS